MCNKCDELKLTLVEIEPTKIDDIQDVYHRLNIKLNAIISKLQERKIKKAV